LGSPHGRTRIHPAQRAREARRARRGRARRRGVAGRRGGSRPRGGGRRSCDVRSHPRADGRPVLQRRRKGSPQHHRGRAGHATEARRGTPLTLRAAVVSASSCKPIKGAAVDVWHADAAGTYSGVLGNTGTFMRGIQKTNAKGLALFQTVYPGWYQGRTVHIHVKVHLGGNVVHTGQLYFPDTVTDAVYRNPPYSSRGNRDVRNAADSIFRNGGSKSLLSVKRN